MGLSEQKQKIKDFMDRTSGKRSQWVKRAGYYYQDLHNFFQYHLPQVDSVLEIGTGTGDVLAGINAKKRTGVDLSPKMLEQARIKYPDIEFIEQDVENINLDDKYDAIIISDTIGYFEDVQTAFENLRHLTHPGTRLLITYQNFIWNGVLGFAEKLHLKMPTQNIKLNWLDIEDISNLLDLSGFDVVKKGKRFLFPVYIPLVSNLINKYIAHLPFINRFCMTTFVIARPMVKHKEYSVSVLIPTRNEKGNVEQAIIRLPKFGSSQEIIFVEGGSNDGTWEEIQRVAKKYKKTHDIKFYKQEGKGKGDAVRRGFNQARGEILMILDADLTTPPEDLPKFYKAISYGKGEFINGCRLVYPLEKEAMRFLNIIGNKLFSIMFSWLLDQRVKDTLCGTKVITRDNWLKISANRGYFGEFDPFGDYDLIFGATKLDLKYIEIPIRYKARTYGTTNISRFKHGWLLVKMVFFAMGKIKFV